MASDVDNTPTGRSACFPPEVLFAVDVACRAAGASPTVAARSGSRVALELDGACVAALLEAGSGFGAGEDGSWTDAAVAGADTRHQAGVAAVLAVASDRFDGVAGHALAGPVWFHTA